MKTAVVMFAIACCLQNVVKKGSGEINIGYKCIQHFLNGPLLLNEHGGNTSVLTLVLDTGFVGGGAATRSVSRSYLNVCLSLFQFVMIHKLSPVQLIFL